MEINVHELSDKQLDELALKIRKGIQKDRENEKKQFKVLDIDTDARKIALSLKDTK